MKDKLIEFLANIPMTSWNVRRIADLLIEDGWMKTEPDTNIDCSGDVSTMMFGSDTVIVTENVDGELYIIKSKYINDIVDDWKGDCNFVPANDARVFFAAWNGRVINPYDYKDFESLLKLLMKA